MLYIAKSQLRSKNNFQKNHSSYLKKNRILDAHTTQHPISNIQQLKILVEKKKGR
jgi:hypothetical protein